MNKIEIRLASEEDLDLLAKFNKQLIEDEKHDNEMDIAQLKERIRGFIQTDYHAYLFVQGKEIIGYALVDITKSPYYLRQFFVSREKRRRGLGVISFQKLLTILDTKCIDVEVLVWNDIGMSFWKSLGFKDRSVYMRFEQ